MLGSALDRFGLDWPAVRTRVSGEEQVVAIQDARIEASRFRDAAPGVLGIDEAAWLAMMVRIVAGAGEALALRRGVMPQIS